MKLTAKVKLISCAATPDLKSTLETANACCDWISGKAWKAKVFGQYALHKLTYKDARAKFSLSAQMVVRCIGKVADSYKLDHKVKRTFWKHGAFPYDDRILSWGIKGQTVSIWSITGRKRVPFECGPKQLELLKSRTGESDLILYDGNLYLAANCNVDAPEPSTVSDFLGVDLGIAEIAVTSDGTKYTGAAVKGVRHRHRRLRTKLQKKQTRAAKRKLKQLSGREARFATHTNHCIAKEIVDTAKRTGRGIAIEELKGIRARIRARRDQRSVLHSWAFAQLGEFLTYKAMLNGVPLVKVDPRNTSRECSKCRHTDKANRLSQSQFLCRSCGHSANADLNAAVVIASRATCKLAVRAA